jgi:phage terminase small subunit
MRHGLTGKQGRFVAEYLIDLNATQAAVRAGYSPKVAYRQGFENLRKPQVAAALTEAMAQRAARVQFDQDSVLREIALLASSDIVNYVIDDEGNVGLRAGVHPDATRAIASLKKKILHTEAGTLYETEIRLWNKPASVKMAGDHLGVFKAAEQALPDIHLHLGEARHRLTARLKHLARRHAEDGTNGH